MFDLSQVNSEIVLVLRNTAFRISTLSCLVQLVMEPPIVLCCCNISVSDMHLYEYVFSAVHR